MERLPASDAYCRDDRIKSLLDRADTLQYSLDFHKTLLDFCAHATRVYQANKRLRDIEANPLFLQSMREELVTIAQGLEEGADVAALDEVGVAHLVETLETTVATDPISHTITPSDMLRRQRGDDLVDYYRKIRDDSAFCNLVGLSWEELSNEQEAPTR